MPSGTDSDTSDSGMTDSDASGSGMTDSGSTAAGDSGSGESGVVDNNSVCSPSPRLLAAEPLPYLGNIYRPETATDERFHSLWNQVTPENAAKWNAVEATRDVMDWAVLDDAHAFANNFNYPLKFHTLLAANNEPAWLAELPADEQLLEITQWFDEVAARYPSLAQIDVVSEPVSSQPGYINALGGSGVTGWDWVIQSFELAQTRFPDSDLLLNDYKVAAGDSSSTAFLQLATLLKQRNLIDGVGIEGHFLESTPVDAIENRLSMLAELDLPVYLADLDLNLVDDAEQLDKMKAVFPLFYEHEAMQGLTFWGYRENQLWRSDAFLLRQDESDRPALDWLECYVGLEN